MESGYPHDNGGKVTLGRQPQLLCLGGSFVVLLHELLPLNELSSLSRLCRGFASFQQESWLLWQRLFEREAPEEAHRLLQKAQDKQSVKVWKGALMGQIKRSLQSISKWGSKALQQSQKRLAAADQDAPYFLAGKEGRMCAAERRGPQEISECGPLMPPPQTCAARLEVAWNEGGVEAPSVVVRNEALQLLKHGVPWKGKWEKPRNLLELLAIACAPPTVVDAILDAIPLREISLSFLLPGLFQAIRCHRHHLMVRLLDALTVLPADASLVAVACFTKNAKGLRMLLERNADPNAPWLIPMLPDPNALRRNATLPPDDSLSETRMTPLALSVWGRPQFPPAMWAEAPNLISQLLAVGAKMDDDTPLRALLRQGCRIGASMDEVASLAWCDAFTAFAGVAGRPSGEVWLHIAVMPEYVVALLDSKMLPTGSVADRDDCGISVLAKWALRATASLQQRDQWHSVVMRVLREHGDEAAATEIIDVTSARASLPNVWDPDDIWPCPMLHAALDWKDAELIALCLTQPTIDAYSAWKAEHQTEPWMSLIYRLAKVGPTAVETALQQGVRFPQSDTLKCHDGMQTLLGPVGSLALAASEVEADEQEAFGRLAVMLLELEGDNPHAFISQGGVPGDIDAFAGLGYFAPGLPPAWFEPIRQWLAKKS